MRTQEDDFAWQVRHIAWKRAFDIMFSLAALILLIPIFLLIAIVIRLSSRGKIVYSHERIGRGGKPFHCYKFRTMHIDAEEKLQQLLDTNAEMQKEWKESRKLKNDPRITSTGRFLRKTSLDELPQFWNVLKGDLSIVGPRPVARDEVIHYFQNKAPKILSIRPGITGIWQVSGRNDTSYAQRIQLDEIYVDSHSLWLDLKLILQTILRMLFPKGAY